MKKNIVILFLVAIVVGLPFVFRKHEVHEAAVDGDRLVILSPHNEAVKHEFGHGFSEWYYNKTGKKAFIDWRDLGGGKEAIKFVTSTFSNAFKNYWVNDLHKEWTDKVKLAYNNLNIDRVMTPGSIDAEVRDALVNSKISCGVDILFGGGRLEISLLAGKGLFTHSGILELHPDWFTDAIIPEKFSGNYFWEPNDLWFGTAISVFGIIYNKDAIKDMGLKTPPTQWADIADPIYFGKVALADPTMSSSVSTAMEMILQQQMRIVLDKLMAEHNMPYEEAEKIAINQGWDKGLNMIQRICANARYFTDSSPKPILDVAAGNCAAGIAIDYYGLSHGENLLQRTGNDRFGFAMPKGGSVVDPDPIGMLRGAPNPELALAFIEYVLSQEGQKKWCFKLDTPGGPERYALRRSSIRKDLYTQEFIDYRSDPDLNFYRDGADFIYSPEWTVPYAQEFRLIIKGAFIDPHKELVAAWNAIIKAQKQGKVENAEKALQKMQNFSLISYERMLQVIKKIIIQSDPLKALELRSEITHHFAQQYKEARRIAEAP